MIVPATRSFYSICVCVMSMSLSSTRTTKYVMNDTFGAFHMGGAVTARKPGAVTVAEIDAGLADNDGFEKLDPRAVEAARWTDKSILQLIVEIKKHGQPSKSGQVKHTNFVILCYFSLPFSSSTRCSLLYYAF